MAVTLNATRRTERGKNAARRMRSEGRVPAVAYGHGDTTEALSINTHELEKLLSSISVENTLIDVKIDGGAVLPALIREVQWHPSRPILQHIDFYLVHAGERIHLEIPVRLNGNPIGVTDNGGVLQQVIHELSIECLPKDIPEVAELNVRDLDVGDSLHVSDIVLPNVKILLDPELTIVTITTPTKVELPEPTEAEEGIGDVEPELVGEEAEDAADVPATEGGQET